MEQIKLATSDSPKINIKSIGGSLRIKGWDRPEFRADADHDDTLSAEAKGNQIDVTSGAGTMMRLPSQSLIEIGQIARDLIVKSLEGSLEVKDIGSQVVLKNTGDVSFGRVRGNLSAKQLEGDLIIKVLDGNIALRDITGDISLDQIHGNLTCKQIDGRVDINTVDGNAVFRDAAGRLAISKCSGNFNYSGYSGGIKVNSEGNAHLNLETEPESIYLIEASGNIHCRLGPGTSGKIILKSMEHNIKVRTKDINEKIKQPEYSLELGDGSGEIRLVAGGSVDFSISDLEEFDFGEYSFEDDLSSLKEMSSLADEITSQVSGQLEDQIDSITNQIQELTSNIDFGALASDRGRRHLERQKREMERKLAQAQKRVNRKIKYASQESRKGRNYRPLESDPVSDDERKVVLEMLQNKQISVEDAETLLAALEGREPEFPPTDSPVNQEE